MKKTGFIVLAALIAVISGATLTGCGTLKDCAGGSCATP